LLLVSVPLFSQVREYKAKRIIALDSFYVNGKWYSDLSTPGDMDTKMPKSDSTRFLKNADSLNYMAKADSVRFLKNADSLNYMAKADSVRFLKNADSLNYMAKADSVRFLKNADSLNYMAKADSTKFLKNADSLNYMAKSDSLRFLLRGASLILAIDSIGANKSDTIYSGRNTMLVNCDASNNDTVYLANIGITNGFECTVKKIDANATYVVVKAKGGLLIDGASEEKWNTQWQSKTFIYKNFQWYIK
jgi:hypothetical protein